MGVMGRGRRGNRGGLTGMRDHLHMSTSAIALEPRFMFDAAGVATAADAVVHDPNTDAIFDTADQSVDQALLDAAAQATDSEKIPTSTAEPARVLAPTAEATDTNADQKQTDTLLESVPAVSVRTEVVFIDSSVKNYQTLVDGVRPGAEVVLLDASQDGLDQIAQWAQSHSGYDAIHIISHGSEATLFLGTAQITSENLAERSGELAAIGRALTADGDLLLYGCNIARDADGLAFIGNLASATGADVAGSIDSTGASDSGGNWVLESGTGENSQKLVATVRG